MTQDEIIEMARQAGFSDWAVQTPNDLLAFAKLVAEKEREACAAICLGFAMNASMNELEGYDAYRDCEESILARGQA